MLLMAGKITRQNRSGKKILTKSLTFYMGPDPVPTSRLTIRSLDGISLRVWKRPETEPAQPIPDQPEEAAVEVAKCPFH